MDKSVLNSWVEGKHRPPNDAFSVDRVVDSDDGPGDEREVVNMVRHAAHLFVSRVPAPTPANGADVTAVPDVEFQRLAHRYLSALPPELQPDKLLLASLNPDDPGAQQAVFGWLPIGWGKSGVALASRDPWASYWVGGSGSAAASAVAPASAPASASPTFADRFSLVLLASRHLAGRSLGGDVGLRLVLHVDSAARNGFHDVRIAGVSYGRLTAARALAVVPGWLRAGDPSLRKLVAQLQAVMKFPGGVVIEGLGSAAAGLADAVRLVCLGLRERQGAEKTVATQLHAFRFTADVGIKAKGGELQVLAYGAVNELYSMGQAATARHKRAFGRDPASLGPASTMAARRASRADDDLLALQTDVKALWPEVVDTQPMAPPTQRGGPASTQRSDQLRGAQNRALRLGKADQFKVAVRFKRRNEAQDTLKSAGGGDNTALLPIETRMPLRTDRESAVQAYLRANEWFARFDAYGLPALDYFRLAKLPLTLQVGRASRGGPGSEAVNAEVNPLWPSTTVALPPCRVFGRAQELTPQILVSFGAAETAHRTRALTLKGRWRAQTLSLAADARWAWHEFGHVLNYASTGELELPFAHSAGDALAAIACDPDSVLAWDEDKRYLTFAWVQATRRHDRGAALGYCWCGRRNLLRLARDTPLELHQHGYFQEQLLSSSLFRLYRCLGGDTRDLSTPPQGATVADSGLARRRSAADYCVYLIMRATALLGPDSIAPARTPDQFVSALIDADLGRERWDVQANWPIDQARARKLSRRGGRVHKVLRWAFEQQGLYAAVGPKLTKEGIGDAPAVDVFIGDRRRIGHQDARLCDGGYHPVSLDWPSGGPAAWMAAEAAIQRKGAQVRVTLGNRGARPASAVRCVLWACKAGAPRWGWQLVGNGTLATPLAGLGAIGVACAALDFTLPGDWRDDDLWLFANLHSDCDPSNWPLDQAPPNSADELIELVAHDNNLALCPLAKGPA